MADISEPKVQVKIFTYLILFSLWNLFLQIINSRFRITFRVFQSRKARV